jgi:hypothetical protein
MSNRPRLQLSQPSHSYWCVIEHAADAAIARGEGIVVEDYNVSRRTLGQCLPAAYGLLEGQSLGA